MSDLASAIAGERVALRGQHLPGNTFVAQLNAFQRKVAFRNRQIFDETTNEVLRSIRDGSEITGAPGQPVDSGRLRESWRVFYPFAGKAVVATNVPYAPYVEYHRRNGRPIRSGGAKAARQRSLKARLGYGGAHSVKLTRAGFGRIVASVAARVLGRTA